MKWRHFLILALAWASGAALAACPFERKPSPDPARVLSLLNLLAMEECLGNKDNDKDELTVEVHKAIEDRSALTDTNSVSTAVGILANFARKQSASDTQKAEWHALELDLDGTRERTAELSTARTSTELLVVGEKAIDAKWTVYSNSDHSPPNARPLMAAGVPLQPVEPVTCPAEECPAFASRVRMLRVINLMVVLQRYMQRPAFQDQLARGRIELARWDAYRTQSQHQYFWELYLNGRVMATDSKICPRATDGSLKGFCAVPTEQWILMHPDVALRWSHRADNSSEMKPAFIVEMIGHHSFQWKDDKSAEMINRRGWSLAAAYSDFEDGHRWSYGPMIHFNGYNLALTKGPGERWGLMVNLKLADSYFKATQTEDWTAHLKKAVNTTFTNLLLGP